MPTWRGNPNPSIHLAQFRNALASEMARHNDCPFSLAKKIYRRGDKSPSAAIRAWQHGAQAPHNVSSFALLRKICRLYGLPPDYFYDLLHGPNERALRQVLKGLNGTDQKLFRWHLPDDFYQKSNAEKREIVTWIRVTVFDQNSAYGKSQKKLTKNVYSMSFNRALSRHKKMNLQARTSAAFQYPKGETSSLRLEAPARLAQEVVDLVQFKTATLAPWGYRRFTTWNAATINIKVRGYGFVFGAWGARPNSVARGLGIEPGSLTLGLFVFPRLWEWYLNWRCARRGFFTASESGILIDLRSLTRPDAGWIRQHPALAMGLSAVPGLVSKKDIRAAQRNWDRACDTAYAYAEDRLRQLKRAVRKHRDPFNPILPILQAKEPAKEYNKIAEEILLRMPPPHKSPSLAAESVRSFLMLRLAMHLAFRQRNLRELRVCQRGQLPTAETVLARRRCGELRWNGPGRNWEVFMPRMAFKNYYSSFFDGNPLCIPLPDVDHLYRIIEVYLNIYRPILLGGNSDPGVFFVRKTRSVGKSAVYSADKFYDAWRHTIQQYGIYNPFTGKGAVEGLLPHGPHCIRDVVATHVLKQTESFDKSSFAIHGTPEVIANVYGRFSSGEKVAQAAAVLRSVWT